MRKPKGYALHVGGPPRELPDAVKRRRQRRHRTDIHRAYRTVAVSGQILFTGAFLWVAAAFAAMIYAWRKL